jgi:hypothetical protein
MVEDGQQKPLVPLAYAPPQRRFRAAENAFGLAAEFAFVAAIPVPLLSAALGFCWMIKQDKPYMLHLIAFGVVNVVICTGVTFFSCWLRWRSEGANLVPRSVWRSAMLFAAVPFLLLGLPLDVSANPVVTGLFVLKVAMLIAWPFGFGLFNRYFLLTRRDRLNS